MAHYTITRARARNQGRLENGSTNHYTHHILHTLSLLRFPHRNYASPHGNHVSARGHYQNCLQTDRKRVQTRFQRLYI